MLTRTPQLPSFMGRAVRSVRAGTSNMSAPSMPLIRWANLISRLPGRAATAAKFHAARWDHLAWDWTNRSLRRLKGRRAAAAWDWGCWAIFGGWAKRLLFAVIAVDWAWRRSMEGPGGCLAVMGRA